MIRAYQNATNPSAKALELIRLLMLLLVLVGWVMYPLELLLLGHWAESWQSKMPFWLAIPGLVSTLLILFDRKTPWIRLFFIVTMWASVLTGLLGAYFHVVWNFDDEVNWKFEKAMEAVAGSRPVLAAMAFTHMGVTGLLSIYRAE
ncbi:hypothetical protein [Meiothermus cerbereus]|uniref:hypothetical protein n=1 Tax=Meiothermus cerbereus TaxID=65552 RepID=UPI003EEDA375